MFDICKRSKSAAKPLIIFDVCVKQLCDTFDGDQKRSKPIFHVVLAPVTFKALFPKHVYWQ